MCACVIYMVICASVFAVHWGRFHGSLTPFAWGRNSCVRFALFCIWGPHKFSIFGESGSSSRLMTQASFIATCLLNANRLPKHFCAFQSQHLLSRCIYCSRYLSCARRYSAEYFSPYAPPRSLREPLLQLRCHHLALATQLALAQKALFLRFRSLLPLLYLAFFRREKSGRRPREQRHNSSPPKSAFC